MRCTSAGPDERPVASQGVAARRRFAAAPELGAQCRNLRLGVISELSARTLLVPYLFSRRERGVLHWYGMSGYSLDDAPTLLRAYGHDLDPADPAVTLRERPELSDFERRHLQPNMGPVQLRGVWCPKHNLGDAAPQAGRH